MGLFVNACFASRSSNSVHMLSFFCPSCTTAKPCFMHSLDVERFAASSTLFLVSCHVQMSAVYRLFHFWTRCGSYSLHDTV